jgi:hypothetical protein
MPGYTAPIFSNFGRNEYLRSTVGLTFESYTCAASTIPADAKGAKVLQSGTVMAKITSGGDSGKIGPFSATATDGRQTAANIVGVCDSFFPYQMGSGLAGTVQAVASDREVSVLVAGRVVGSACYEYVGAEVSPGTRGLSAGTKTSLSTRAADRNILVS